MLFDFLLQATVRSDSSVTGRADSAFVYPALVIAFLLNRRTARSFWVHNQSSEIAS